MIRIVDFFAKLPVVAQFIELTKRLRLPGFENMPLFDVAQFFSGIK